MITREGPPQLNYQKREDEDKDEHVIIQKQNDTSWNREVHTGDMVNLCKSLIKTISYKFTLKLAFKNKSLMAFF